MKIYIIPVSVTRISTFFGTRRIWVFDGISAFKTIRVYIPCKKLSYLGKITLVSLWSRMYTKILSPWHIHQYEYLTGITILIPVSRFFDTIDDVVYWYYCIHLYIRPTLVQLPKAPVETPIKDQFWKQAWCTFWILWPHDSYFLCWCDCDCDFGRVELLHMWFAGCWEMAASLDGIACWPLKTTSPLSSAWVFVSFGPHKTFGHISSSLIWPIDFSKKYYCIWE